MCTRRVHTPTTATETSVRFSRSLCAVKVLLAFAALHLDCARSANGMSLSVHVRRAVGAQNKVNKYCHFDGISADFEGCEGLSKSLFT